MTKINTNLTPAVILVHGTGVNGLGLVRSLGRKHIPVYVMGIKGHKNLASLSRFCTDTILIDEFNGGKITQSLHDLAQKFDEKPVLFFDNDKMMIELSSFADKIEPYYHMTCPLSESIAVTDKIFQMNAAIEAELDVPVTWHPKTWDELESLAVKKGSRVIAKPSPAFYPPEKLPFKIIVGKDLLELRELLEQKVNLPDGIIVQEFIEGGDEDVFVAICYRSEKNNINKAYSAQKLRQSPAGAGVMAIGQAIDSSIVRDISNKLISHINYSGIVSTEFKYSQDDGKYYFIEFNPRPGQFHTIGRKSNFELAYIAYLDHTNPSLLDKIPQHNEHNHKWIYTRLYIETLLQGQRKEKFKDFISLFKGEKEWAVYVGDDIKPWILASRDFIIWIIRKQLVKIKHALFGKKK